MIKIMKTIRSKKKGAASVPFALLIILLMFIYLMADYSIQSNKVIASKLDSSLTVSMLGSAIINLNEYGRTHEISIFDDLPSEYSELSNNVNGIETIYKPAGNLSVFKDNVTTSMEFMVDRNNYLNKSLNTFKSLIKTNMVLDDNYVPVENDNRNCVLSSKYKTVDGASGTNKVEIEEYTIVNVYRYRDWEVPYNEHTYTCTYRCTDGNNFYLVPELSGRDITMKVDSSDGRWGNVVKGGRADGTEITSTSVYARLSFYTDIYVGNNGLQRSSIKRQIDRVVSIKNK